MDDPSVKKFVRVVKQQKPTEATTLQQLESVKRYYILKRHQKTVLGYAASLFFSLTLLVVSLYLKAWCPPHMACAAFLPASVIVMYFDEVDKTRGLLGYESSFEPYVALRSPLVAALSILSLVEFGLVVLASIGFFFVA